MMEFNLQTIKKVLHDWEPHINPLPFQKISGALEGFEKQMLESSESMVDDEGITWQVVKLHKILGSGENNKK